MGYRRLSQGSSQIPSGVGTQASRGHCISEHGPCKLQGPPDAFEVSLSLDPPDGDQHIGRLDFTDTHFANATPQSYPRYEVTDVGCDRTPSA